MEYVIQNEEKRIIGTVECDWNTPFTTFACPKGWAIFHDGCDPYVISHNNWRIGTYVDASEYHGEWVQVGIPWTTVYYASKYHGIARIPLGSGAANHNFLAKFN